MSGNFTYRSVALVICCSWHLIRSLIQPCASATWPCKIDSLLLFFHLCLITPSTVVVH